MHIKTRGREGGGGRTAWLCWKEASCGSSREGKVSLFQLSSERKRGEEGVKRGGGEGDPASVSPDPAQRNCRRHTA